MCARSDRKVQTVGSGILSACTGTRRCMLRHGKKTNRTTRRHTRYNRSPDGSEYSWCCWTEREYPGPLVRNIQRWFRKQSKSKQTKEGAEQRKAKRLSARPVRLAKWSWCTVRRTSVHIGRTRGRGVCGTVVRNSPTRKKTNKNKYTTIKKSLISGDEQQNRQKKTK